MGSIASSELELPVVKNYQESEALTKSNVQGSQVKDGVCEVQIPPGNYSFELATHKVTFEGLEANDDKRKQMNSRVKTCHIGSGVSVTVKATEEAQNDSVRLEDMGRCRRMFCSESVHYHYLPVRFVATTQSSHKVLMFEY